MHLIIISLMLVLQSPQKFHMSMEVSMITLIINVKNLFLISVTESEVVSAVNELSFKISTDYIGLNMEIIEHVILNIAKPLCYISNKSFLDGIFPDKMKIAKIIQIYKSGHKNLICNHRPISLLSQFSKILEKLFKKRLQNFITKKTIF